MKQITQQAFMLAAFLCISMNSYAQFENKISLNFSVTSFSYMSESQVKAESEDAYARYYDEYYNDITAEYAFATEEVNSGIGLTAGLQYNFSSRFSIEGLFRFSYMNYTTSYFYDYLSYQYIDGDEYNLDPSFYQQQSVQSPERYDHYNGDTQQYTGRSGYYAQRSFPYYGREYIVNGKGNFFTFDIAIVPKLYLNPRNKFKVYLFTEAHLNFAAGYDIDYDEVDNYYALNDAGQFVITEGTNEQSNVTGGKEDVESNINFGLIPGLGFDLVLNQNMSLFLQGGYGVMDSYKDMLMVQGGVKISAFKSKSL
ncbi:hypothetical protein [Flammeovirga sp. OC4]|uniref:hypothetical protein n=1 Tax=Flammeovirga sp. OC4 TaxID=1382345 RepID=UPI0012E0459F|nr:hypothetical protein [Flammeovirga sp. OC4]